MTLPNDQAQSPALEDWLAEAHEHPRRVALFLDVDGTLAPVVDRAEDAIVPTEVSRILGRLSAKLGMVACVSGRAADDAKRLVGVGGIWYAGAHGAELIAPTGGGIERAPELAEWEGPIQEFAQTLDKTELRQAGVRLEDKSFIQALHWRGAEDAEEAEALVRAAEAAARERGFEIHHGRKVLEIRPPIRFSKGIVVTRLLKQSGLRNAAFFGDDNTDVDAFDAIAQLQASQSLDTALRVGVRSPESPERLLETADVLVDGTAGVRELLQAI